MSDSNTAGWTADGKVGDALSGMSSWEAWQLPEARSSTIFDVGSGSDVGFKLFLLQKAA